MRFAAFAIVLAMSAPAHADTGVYFSEALGGVGFRGEVAGSAPRLQIGGGIRRGSWAIEATGALSSVDFFTIDCYGDECNAPPSPGVSHAAVDVRRQWVLWKPRWNHAGVVMYLRGGLRWFAGDGAIAGYRGPGIGTAAGIEGDIWVLGYFIDFGYDAMWLRGQTADPPRAFKAHPAEDRSLTAGAPYVVFGGKVGWM